MAPRAFVAVLTVHLHFPDSASLKARRRELAPVRAHLERRLGASVTEAEHHEQWQRATLVAALTAGSAGRLEDVVDRLRAWLDARFPGGARVESRVLSLEDLEG